MGRRLIIMGAALLLIWGPLAGAGFPEVKLEWKIVGQLDLPAAPLDVAASEDGRWILILAPGEVLVYSVPDNTVINRIPLGGRTFDKLTYSTRDNAVILTSSSDKSLEIIQLDLVHDILVSGLPFMGPEDAPVTLAVFDDYQ